MHWWLVIWLAASAAVAIDPVINFIDGTGEAQCKTRLERKLTGWSGWLVSHELFGASGYNSGRNCFVTLTVPVGYRIRLKVVEFDVLGHISNCHKDTLHVFNHDTMVDPNAKRQFTDDSYAPGPIVGQYCGRINASTVLSESTQNALTLWWHADGSAPVGHGARGFKLSWNAFRTTKSVATGKALPCASHREFTCGSEECIPLELACDEHADCADASDLLPSRQIDAKCDIDMQLLSSVSSGTFLLVIFACLLLLGCTCMVCVALCRQPQQKGDKSEAAPSSLSSHCSQHCGGTALSLPNHYSHNPPPPAFFPPSPPKMPPPSAVSTYSPNVYRPDASQHYYRVSAAPAHPSYHRDPEPSEYTYVRNDTVHNLL